MGIKYKGKMPFVLIILLSIFCFSTIAVADSLPGNLALEQVKRVDFGRADTTYLALFPDLDSDREKIGNLLLMYNQALKNLSAEELIDFGDDMTFFMYSVDISLNDGQIIGFYLHDNGIYFITDYQNDGLHGYRIIDEALDKKFYDLALSYFVPAQGVTINSRELRLGDEVKISSDCAYGEAKIFLMPTYTPCTIPSAPDPYPIPEAILIAQVPVEHDRFTYTFSLTEKMGKTLDGSGGKIAAGEWQVVVKSEGSGTYLPIMILPREIPEPLAVAYDRGRVLVWNEQGIVGDYRISNFEQPLLINNSKFNEQTMTYLSLDFLRKYLGIQVGANGEGQYSLGGTGLGMNIETNRQYAKMNGTMPYLTGYLGDFGGSLRLPWEGIAGYFAYKTKWLGPEQVVFLRNLDKIPPALLNRLNSSADKGGKLRQVQVAVNGKQIAFKGQAAYLDPMTQKIMVPLRDTVKALGGKVIWYPLYQPENPQDEDPYDERWLDTGVASYTQVSLGNRVWGLYRQFLPENTGVTKVSLRQLALALGYDLTWDAQNKQVIMSLH